MADDVAVLVHGTFAKRAHWIEPGSTLAGALQAQVPHLRTVAFNWSGKNSHAERLAAGGELAAELSRICERFPDARVHLIGHSHGGNVIRYALNNHPCLSRVASTSYLGTPFLVPTRLENAARFRFLGVVASYLLMFLASIGSGSIAMGLLEPLLETRFAGAVLVGALALALAGGAGGFAAGPPLGRWLENQVRCRQRQGLAQFEPAHSGIRSFIATVPRDEAGALLTGLDRLSFLPIAIADHARGFAQGVGIGAGLLFLAMICCAVAAGVVEALGGGAIEVLEAFPVVLAMIVTTLFLLSCLTVLLAAVSAVAAATFRSMPFAFGGEDIALILALRIQPRQLPDEALMAGSMVKSYPSHRSFWSLHHSAFYNDPEVVRDLAEWVAGHTPPDCQSEKSPERPRQTESRSGARLGLLTTGIAVIAIFVLIKFDLPLLVACLERIGFDWAVEDLTQAGFH